MFQQFLVVRSSDVKRGKVLQRETPSTPIQALVEFQLLLVSEKQILLMARKLQQEDGCKFSVCICIHWIAFFILKGEERDA